MLELFYQLIFAVLHSFLVRLSAFIVSDYTFAMIVTVFTALVSIYVNITNMKKYGMWASIGGYFFYLVCYYFSDKFFAIMFEMIKGPVHVKGSLFDFERDLFTIFIPLVTMLFIIVIRVVFHQMVYFRKKPITIVDTTTRLVLLFLIPLILTATFGAVQNRMTADKDHATFNSQSWRQNVEGREKLFDQFVSENNLEGQSKQFILTNLGTPEGKDEKNHTLVYQLSKTKKLKIIFNEQDSVESFEKVNQ